MVDVMLHLVDRGLLDGIMSMTVGEISSGMEGSSLRNSRPGADPRFHRDFDVDLEGEVLELIDASSDLGRAEKLSHATSDASMELRLLLAKWCSSAQWRCWDARLFLYVEPILDGPFQTQTTSCYRGCGINSQKPFQGPIGHHTLSLWYWTGCLGGRIWGRLWNPLRTQ